uniref:RxLR effector candidate protein n=1 Tax=Peronospora matthiolae TaxID=2874970 RepID=A0AAV1TV96_9STRA
MIKCLLLFVLLLSAIADSDALLAFAASTPPDGTPSDQDQTIESKVRDERALHASRDTTAAAGEERALVLLPVVKESFKSGLEKSWVAWTAKKLAVWKKVESVPSEMKAAQMKKNEEYWKRTAAARAEMAEEATRRVEAAKMEEEKKEQMEMKAYWEKRWDHWEWVKDTWRTRRADYDGPGAAQRKDMEAELREYEQYLEEVQDARTKGQAAWREKEAAWEQKEATWRKQHPNSEAKSVLREISEFRWRRATRAWEKEEAALNKEVGEWKDHVKASKYALAKAEIAAYLPDFAAMEKENYGLIHYQDLLDLDPKIVKDLDKVTHENLFAFKPDYRRYLYFTKYHGVGTERLLVWLKELFAPKKTSADVGDTAVGQPSV